MKRSIVLAILTTVMAGCAGAPAAAPESAPVQAPVAEVAPTPAPAIETPAPAVETPAPAVETPVPAPEVKLPTSLLDGLTRVAAPTLDELPASWRSLLAQHSPWSVADTALFAIYGGKPLEGPFIAPSLQVQPIQPTPATTWRRHVSSWDQEGRFYFHLRVTAQAADGRLYRAGEDVVEVSPVGGAGYVVTGHRHIAPAPAPANGPVTVWAAGAPGSSTAPQEVTLPAPTVEQAPGHYLVPAQVVTEFKLADPVATTKVNGIDYVAVTELVRALTDTSVTSGSESFTYGVAWRPDLRQLILRTSHSYPIS